MKRWKSTLWKTGLLTTVGLLAFTHHSWASTTGIAAVDTGINEAATFVQNGAALVPAVGGAVGAGVGWVMGHDFSRVAFGVGMGAITGGYMHHVAAVNGSFGGATAALLHHTGKLVIYHSDKLIQHADKLTMLAHAVRHLV